MRDICYHRCVPDDFQNVNAIVKPCSNLALFQRRMPGVNRQTKLREGNVFARVCLFTGGGEGELVPYPSGTTTPWEHTPRPDPRNHKSGWYTSYWNAFLFSLIFTVDVVIDVLKYAQTTRLKLSDVAMSHSHLHSLAVECERTLTLTL